MSRMSLTSHGQLLLLLLRRRGRRVLQLAATPATPGHCSDLPSPAPNPGTAAMHRINRLRPHLPVLLVALLLAAVLPDGAAGLGCLDFDGAAVDWYIIYKLPGGLAYTYTDAQRANGSLPAAPGRDDLSADDSPLTRTVFSVLSARASSASVIYNDDIPEGSVDERIYRGDGAHAKGILAADAVGALWLIHSVRQEEGGGAPITVSLSHSLSLSQEPNYPSMVSSNYWADARCGRGPQADLAPATQQTHPSPAFHLSSTIYAQSFLCLSLDVASANVAALQLQYMQPKIYSHSLPEALKSSYPGFEGLLAGEEPGDVSVAELSVGDARPLSFAKSPDWGFDLYEVNRVRGGGGMGISTD